jgi:hypothetical protein
MPERFLQSSLGLIAVVCVGANLQAILLPRWPRANLPPMGPLSLKGYQVSSEPSLPGSATSDLAISSTARFRLVPGSSIGGNGDKAPDRVINLQMAMLVPRGLRSFQVAAATKDRPDLRLEQRRILFSEGNELAVGLIKGRTALQTCLTRSGSTAVTQEALGRVESQQPPLTLKQQMARIIGLRLNRNPHCLLITVTKIDKPLIKETELLTLWNQLKPELKGLLPS